MNETIQQGQKPRWLLWVTGSVLWGIVIVWLLILQRSSHSDSSQNRDSNELTSANAAKNDNVKKPIWDANGIEDFELTERSGRKVTKADLLGRPWAVCFIFTYCQDTCPRITSQFKRLQDRLTDADVRLVSISVDPKRDTPEKLQKYADTYKADPKRWLFLTGNQEVIYRLIQRSFKLPVRKVQGLARKPGFEVSHSNFVLHVDAQGRVVEKYDATKDTDMVKLQRALLAEASTLQQARESSGKKEE